MKGTERRRLNKQTDREKEILEDHTDEEGEKMALRSSVKRACDKEKNKNKRLDQNKLNGDETSSQKRSKKLKNKRTHDELSDELPAVEELLSGVADDNQVNDNDQGQLNQPSLTLQPPQPSSPPNKKSKRRKTSKKNSSAASAIQPQTSSEHQPSAPAESIEIDTTAENNLIRPVNQCEKPTKRKASEKNSLPSSQTLANGQQSNEDEEETNSQCSENSTTQIDYQLDKVLIDRTNYKLLGPSPHFTVPTLAKLMNKTCRDILASWLSTTQLNELVKIYGFKYKQGRFSTAEKALIEKTLNEFCTENSTTVINFLNISRTQSRRGERDSNGSHRANTNGLISRISTNLEGRPNISIWQFIRRAYNPKSKLGKWTEDEENLLQESVQKYGTAWTKVSEMVCRSADDCRDRWRNYTVTKGKRNSGGWSKEEEDQLIELMSKSQAMNFSSSQNQVEGLWTWVSEQMGGSRSRAQCRIKWVDSLKPKLQDPNIHWTNRDVLTLAQKLKKHNFEDEVGFDWKQVKFSIWSASSLQKSWKQLKKFIIKKNLSSDSNSSDLPLKNSEILDQVLHRWSNKPESFLNSRVQFAKSLEHFRMLPESFDS